ncbi:NAD(P)-dependent oxidoreductase [Amycolatopsis sp. FDAARGOS 1241]|uniref:NAD(P)-dependent oxidoreductase n=1 Tax=Amycolatopsis sp. FDAARGOS 1241 TaxID=2778070 RepID=UPI001951A60C|nr:NAD(P)-dependent oxidoreductase [Amycolatopsis sp. FDAARGOS 1241]QRP49398.1 NAD(P)-dependent oxidoreductase [Amycolatopsis sp. FDAARGOS 1241]
MKVAVLGLGAMGSQLVLRLLDQGVDVTGWNRDPARGRRAGIPAERLARSASDAARGADVVITMLADGRAVRSVVTGVLDALPRKALVLDLSTSGPELSREVAGLVTGRGLRFAEAPVSGSVGAARGGTLTIMFGGGADELAAAEPVLRHLGRQTIHIGPVGTAATLKLCVNALLHTFNATLGEVLGAAVAAGIDLRTAYDTIGSSAVAAPFVGYKRDAFLAAGRPPVACAVDVVRKDLELFLDAVPDPGLDAPTVRTAVGVVHRAQAAGLGQQDMATLAHLYRPGGAGEP